MSDNSAQRVWGDTSTMTVRFVSGAVAVVAAVMLTPGCAMLTEDPYAPTSAEDTARAAEMLVGLQSLEEVELATMDAIEEIALRATALDPLLQWRRDEKRRQGSCARPFDQTDGQKVSLPFFVSNDASITDEIWPQVFELARTAAAAVGAANVQVLQDSPGKHDVHFYNETGTSIRIGSEVSALITGDTGCRLPQAKELPN